MLEIAPVVLEGHHVRLEPLSLDHLDDLTAAGADPGLWTYMFADSSSREGMRDFIESAGAEQARGVSLPFAVIDLASGRAVGSSRYGNIDRANHRVEIGWTWYAPAAQRSPVNTESKLLLLGHAFEGLGCIRVEFKTDSLNTRSRQAIARLGATEEGTFRNHMITRTGRYRHTVYFSLIEEEWPGVKGRLTARLAAG